MLSAGIFYEHTAETTQKSPGNPGFFAFGAKSPVFILLLAGFSCRITPHTTQHGGGDENEQKHSNRYDDIHQKFSSESLPPQEV